MFIVMNREYILFLLREDKHRFLTNNCYFRECGLDFPNREALNLHQRLHTGDRTLVTDLCGLAAAFQQTPAHFLTPNTPTAHQVIISMIISF